MTTDEAAARVRAISAVADDDEKAHSMEDALRRDVLEAIAKGVENPSLLASIALSTSEVPFSRWCA